MRQTGIRIILLCTGILMLVLSVLPHHHHCDGSIRFSVVEQCSECQQAPVTASHHHPETDNDCDLRQLFVMSGRNDSDHQFSLCHTHDLQPADAFVFTLFYYVYPDLSLLLSGHGSPVPAVRCRFTRSRIPRPRSPPRPSCIHRLSAVTTECCTRARREVVQFCTASPE